MTEQNAQPARPIAPGPSLEEQLRKAVEDRPNRRIAAHPDLGAPFRGGIGGAVYGGTSPVPTPLPTGMQIANRLARALDRLRSVEQQAEGIAVTLAGPGVATSLGRGAAEQPPAASLFVIYERTLDEIDRIIDNIESEQARTRNILGE